MDFCMYRTVTVTWRRESYHELNLAKRSDCLMQPPMYRYRTVCTVSYRYRYGSFVTKMFMIACYDLVLVGFALSPCVAFAALTSIPFKCNLTSCRIEDTIAPKSYSYRYIVGN